MGLVIVALVVVIIIFVAASLLPFFVGEVSDSLWSAEGWPASRSRYFTRAGPLCGASAWPALLAIPVSSTLVLAGLVLAVAYFLLGQRRH